jgi:hypothetical protein
MAKSQFWKAFANRSTAFTDSFSALTMKVRPNPAGGRKPWRTTLQSNFRREFDRRRQLFNQQLYHAVNGGSMSQASRRMAGALLVVLPTVMIGGLSLLSMLIGDPSYMQNPLRQNLWRAGHAHAGVLLILSLVALRYVDEATLSNAWKQVVRLTIPLSAIFLPAAFFLSVLSPDATKPNSLINLAYVGAVSLATGLLLLGVGLIRKPQ